MYIITIIIIIENAFKKEVLLNCREPCNDSPPSSSSYVPSATISIR